MDEARFFALFTLAALVVLLGLGVARFLVLRARGISVFAVDRNRGTAPILSDGLEAMFLLGNFYVLFAFATPFPGALVPPVLDGVLVSATAVRAGGAALMVAGIVIYALALRAMGESWRIGIDREKHGPLVTGGIFAWSRNPIYLSLNLFGLGAFLSLGRELILVLLVANAFFIDALIRREERFLAGVYGEAFRQYRARVGRYLKLPFTR